ncbi:MAG: bifunctional (p)ppGpp synthetase/guanosine-3',5'-bis(diphosphate) 3'-pyrophosphohydrolase [Deltaproteobacteria bacterium]|nr:bifunctional (p)ppGpp synthetase/guanosine-3',5'-bis(diphosphate) 3'-pyrophosphohydrolase [Deltaproteobacteria bacterium]
MIRLGDILDEVKKHDPGADLDLIRRAYVFSAKAHAGQLRKSGEPYLSHPLEVCHILARMRMDALTVATGFLHDTVEDNAETTLEQIEQAFGKDIAGLVDGVTKIGRMQFTSREHQQAENFKKILIATSRDFRVLLIKLADRLHNMRTLEHMPPEKRRFIAQETIDIYAPLANRLGMQWVKNELEDHALRYIDPRGYYEIVFKLSQGRRERDQFIDEVIGVISDLMGRHGIEAEILGRLKNVHSIYKKMQVQELDFEQVHDLIAFRVIVGSVAECYEALGYVHSTWKPVPGRFKDYIALPKANMYQSLHTTVVGPRGQRMEVQIRTVEMNRIAEEGIAAHWRYKEGRAPAATGDAEKFEWLRKMVELYQEENPREYMKALKVDLFPDEAYVFTPKGDVLAFPRGATPVDFAYRIHTEVGHQCVGARVNGHMVPLDYKLVSGDRLEIMTRRNHAPSRDWLRFVKTTSARAKIREYLRKQEMDRSVEAGKSLLEKELRKRKLSLSRLDKAGKLEEAAKNLAVADVNRLYANLGVGKISLQQLIAQIIGEDAEPGEFKEDALEKNSPASQTEKRRRHQNR